jgi:hypothetical protein
MIETLLGGLFGGLFRLAPEVMKLFDRKAERTHELSMLGANLAADKLRGEQALTQLDVQREISLMGAGLAALQEAIKGQSQLTGIRKVDILTMSVRPIVTYWFMSVYCFAKVATFVLVFFLAPEGASAADKVKTAIDSLWTPADMALFAGILNFWFLGRVFERAQSARGG